MKHLITTYNFHERLVFIPTSHVSENLKRLLSDSLQDGEQFLGFLLVAVHRCYSQHLTTEQVVLMKAVSTSETLIIFHRTTRRYVPEDIQLKEGKILVDLLLPRSRSRLRALAVR
ncbi:uncharacterized protein LOC110835426 isoform X2 [Zootermopsis nevadensis]|uniref:uncharacterized protein LOC110835426 isoform X2 n=1 Tax=Zootermopsis nevadensis TaxID=136037 RepID=UPI000B8EBBD6|nr:uncharacterized protein LOC110835426 isoform X2 [Zootermopsis nevadensis]